MALIVAGIDEAGYGPLLGPLTVACCVLRVSDWCPGDPAPDVWRLLERAVSRAGGEPRGRIRIDDSKRLKLPNLGPGETGRHPLLHLEVGVLAFAAQLERSPCADDELFRQLGVDLGDSSWALGSSSPLPVAWEAGSIAIAANSLAKELERARVGLLRLACEAVSVERFNQTVKESGTKGEATIGAIGRHLRAVLGALGTWAGEHDHIRFVCDRLGGRTAYAEVLERELGRPVRVLEESDRCSRYACSLDRHGIDDDGQGIGLLFMPECERAHLPVALASMTAKYVRELAMARFNRHWCERIPNLKPTAGYRQDAARWLRDAAAFLGDEDRRELVRLA